MSLDMLLDKPVTFVLRTELPPDDYGQPGFVETEVEGRCYYQFGATAEQDAVAREEIWYTLYVHVDSSLVGLHQVILDGVSYDHDGVTHRQWNPRLSRYEYQMIKVRRAAS